ncbi:ion transporter [Reinekea forsetii]|nr:ion transporter [Reinekea forsetii]
MKQNFRKKTAHLLSVDAGGSVSRWVDYALISLITLNVLAIIMESVPSFEARYREPLVAFEVFSVMVFTVEFILRVWSCIDTKEYQHLSPIRARLAYLRSPMALVDIIAILPFYLMMFVSIDLRFLRIIRLLRIFKLTRYSAAMNLVISVFKEEAGAFLAAFFVLMMLLVLASSGIYLLEHDIQPEVFGTIPDAMWWAMATLTTVGYGDAVPITPLGKLFGASITIIGVGMVALPAGILASGFSDLVHRRKSLYKNELEAALSDGILTHNEEQQLEALREKLGLSTSDIDDVTHAYMAKIQHSLRECPHCHQPLFRERESDRDL